MSNKGSTQQKHSRNQTFESTTRSVEATRSCDSAQSDMRRELQEQRMLN